MSFVHLDVALNYARLLELIKSWKPDAIIHFAEQRAAPYSMKNSTTKRYTVNNNLNATHNTLCAIVESGLDVHLAHLGTMGVYGYGSAGMRIPEGYLRVKFSGESIEDSAETIVAEKEILYPPDPGSVYHLTKVQDALFFYYYNKNYGTRITDLHQGIVWGTNTPETSRDERLINRFDYDGDYGTVLNRFLMQAAIGHPLTVHGTGGQTRAFLHIRDTVKCIELALKNPPERGERVKIFNQMAETHRLSDLAARISKLTGSDIQHLDNPRNEASSNDLHVSNKCFIDLGLKPIKLSDGLLMEIKDIAQIYASRCDKEKIICRSRWK